MKIKLYILIYIYIFATSFSSCIHKTALMESWPDQKGSHNRGNEYNNASVKNALIVLDSNDTLNGEVKFVPFQTNVANNSTDIELLPLGKREKSEIMTVDGETISFIRLFADDVKNKKTFTDYYRYTERKRAHYLRVYAAKGNFKICVQDYDYSEDPNHFHGNYYVMYLISPSGMTKLGVSSHVIVLTSEPSKILLKFINNQYNQHFKREDFRDGHAMADYILEKENEK